jgi:hypothetical protein
MDGPYAENGMGIIWLQTALLGSGRNTIGKVSCKSCDEKSYGEENEVAMTTSNTQC